MSVYSIFFVYIRGLIFRISRYAAVLFCGSCGVGRNVVVKTWSYGMYLVLCAAASLRCQYLGLAIRTFAASSHRTQHLLTTFCLQGLRLSHVWITRLQWPDVTRSWISRLASNSETEMQGAVV